MNAPVATTSPDDDLLGVYASAITNLLPQCCGEELELRCRLLRARESANLALNHCATETAPILGEIVRLSFLYAYAPVSVERLRALVMCLRRLMSASAFADSAFEEGEAGARGR